MFINVSKLYFYCILKLFNKMDVNYKKGCERKLQYFIFLMSLLVNQAKHNTDLQYTSEF